MFGSVGIYQLSNLPWSPTLLWLRVLSESLVALAYFLVSFALLRTVRRRKDIPFRWIYYCFAAFTVSRGLTVAMDVSTLGQPNFWVSGTLRACNIAISIVTLVVLLRVSPAILAIPDKLADLRFKELIEDAPDAIVQVDAAGAIVIANRTAEKMFGYTREELLGSNVDLLIPMGNRAAHPKHRDGFVESGTTRAMGHGMGDLHARRKDGTELSVEIALSRVQTAAGVHVTAAIRDVSDRKRIEQELERTAEQLNSLLQSTTVCVLAVDSTWNLHYMNRNATEVLAVRRDVLGMTLWEAFPEMVPEDQAFLQKVMTTRQAGSHESFYPPLNLTTTVQAHPWKKNGIAVFFTDVGEQKRLERELESANTLLTSVLENTELGLFAVDSKWRLRYFNDHAKQTLHADGERIGTDMWDLFPEQQPVSREKLLQAMATRLPVSFDSYYEPLDLSTHVSVHPWLDGLTVYFTDISAQKRLERDLQTANRRAASVLENTNVSIYAVDGSWTVRYINENAKRTLGYRGDMLGKNLWEAFPDLEPEASAQLRGAMASRVPVMFESYYQPLDLWTNVKIHPWDEAGITVYFSDISERKQAERELARTNDRLASVLDNTSVGIYAIDRDWKFTYVNENAKVLLKTMGDVMGKDLRIAFPDQQPSTRQRLEQVMSTREPVAFESYYPTLDLSTNISAHPLDDGGITIYFSDISVQRRLERELETERAQRQQRIEVLARLSSGLAHEIKNPLAIIHARASDLAELAEGGEVDRAEIGRSCASIVQTSDRAIRILRGVAAMARVGTHDPMADADVAGMVQQAVELVEGRYRVSGIRLKSDMPPSLPMLECREVQIVQILVNLLNNAFDAVESNARSERWVRVEVSVQPGAQHQNDIDRLEISVIDGGPGVAPEHRERLMQTFFTTKSMGAGIGIGLSVSRTTAEDHGGQLELRDCDGHTCFTLTLPVKAGTPEEVAA